MNKASEIIFRKKVLFFTENNREVIYLMFFFQLFEIW